MQFFIKLLHVKGLFIKTLLFTFCGALWLLSLTSCKSSAGKEKKILIVESYEKTYKGYENNKAKIEALFKKEGIKASLHFIYLDSEQYLEEQETERMRNLVDAENGWKPDLIMVFNDQATYSLMKCGASLSQSVPIIFAT